MDVANKKSGMGRKLAIVSISLLVMTYNSVSVVMSDMVKAFPNVDPTSIQSFLSITTFSIMVFTLISGVLTGFMRKRTLLLIGLAIYTLGGIAPVFLTDFNLLLASRIIMGVGIGLVNPIAASLIGDYYEGSERAQLMGFKTTAGSFGQTATTFIAGILALSGWHNAFWIYLLGVILFVIVLFWVPEPPKAEDKKTKSADAYKINTGVLVIAFGMLLFFIAYMAIMVNLSIVVVEANLGNAATVGTQISLMMGISMIVSIFFGQFYKMLGKYIAVIGAFLYAAGFMVLANAQSMQTMVLAMVMFGVGNGFTIPFAYDRLAYFSPKTSMTFCMSIMMVASNIGAFVSPYFMTIFASVFGNNSSYFKFIISSVLFLVIMVIALVYAISARKKKTVSS